MYKSDMNLIDQFWFDNMKTLLKDFEIDILQINEESILKSLKNLRQFISTNSTNKNLIIQKSEVSSQLVLLCSKLSKEEILTEYSFLEELLGTLNSLAAVQDFRLQMMNTDFINLLFHYIIKMDGNVRKNSVLLLRTMLNARNINATLTSDSEMYIILKECLTSDVMSNFTVIPCLSLNCDDILDPNIIIEKRTGLYVLQLLSVLSTSADFNEMMFSNQQEYLHVLHRIIMELNTASMKQHAVLSVRCPRTEVKYILKIIAYYIFYNTDSVEQLSKVHQCTHCSDLINCYEFILWIDENYIIALLGLVRGLIFWRLCLKIMQDDASIHVVTTFGENIVSVGLGLTLDDIVKLIINPLTFNDSYLEFNGLGCWVLHALFLVLQQHFNLSELLMQCNGFLDIVNKKLTPKIQSGLERDTFGSTDIIKLEKLAPLFKLLAWMCSESDSVKVWVGESEFFSVALESYHKSCSFQIPKTVSEVNFQKSIWLLIQALSRNIHLHRTLFCKVSRYSNFIKEFTDTCISTALSLSHSTVQSSIIEIIYSCLCTVSNLVLPTSPLRNDLLEWALNKFISMTNGEMLQLTDTNPELKLCGMRGLVNTAYSILLYDKFHLTNCGDMEKQNLTMITSHLIDVLPSTFGSSVPDSFILMDLHEKIVLMIWTLFRNTLKSIEVIERTVVDRGYDIINFIVSTLESERLPLVKEQALIVLAHIATHADYRKRLLDNEDLLEKIKLFAKSANYQLKMAAVCVAFYLMKSGSMDYIGDLMSLEEDLRNDCKELWEYLESVNKPDVSLCDS